MRTTRLVALGVLAVLTWATPGPAQISKSPLMTTFPGWGVQAWADELVGYPRGVIAEAFHFSPDGSFYFVLDEGTIMKIAVTIDVKQAITKHKIPIDAIGVVQVILDGVPIDPWVNDEHRVVELDLSPGKHTLVMINNSYIDVVNVGLMVVGKCLWGTDKNIAFVKAGLPDPQ
jgi:hypothetical protein